MKTTILLIAATLSLGVSGTACAQDSSGAAVYEDNTPASKPVTQTHKDVKVSFALSAATDYVWRGVSQSDNHAAVFATVNVSASGFYAGAGTENVDFLGIHQEYDLWGGYVVDLGPAKLDVGVVRYGYVNSPVDIDTLEAKVALTGAIGKLNLGAAGYYTGNYFGSGKDAIYAEVTASYPLMEKLTASAALGHQQISNAPDYTTWNLGLRYKVLPGATVGVSYIDTDIRPSGRLSRARVMGNFSIGF